MATATATASGAANFSHRGNRLRRSDNRIVLPHDWERLEASSSSFCYNHQNDPSTSSLVGGEEEEEDLYHLLLKKQNEAKRGGDKPSSYSGKSRRRRASSTTTEGTEDLTESNSSINVCDLGKAAATSPCRSKPALVRRRGSGCLMPLTKKSSEISSLPDDDKEEEPAAPPPKVVRRRGSGCVMPPPKVLDDQENAPRPVMRRRGSGCFVPSADNHPTNENNHNAKAPALKRFLEAAAEADGDQAVVQPEPPRSNNPSSPRRRPKRRGSGCIVASRQQANAIKTPVTAAAAAPNLATRQYEFSQPAGNDRSRKNVRFGTTTVYSHALMLGDYPHVEYALQLDWVCYSQQEHPAGFFGYSGSYFCNTPLKKLSVEARRDRLVQFFGDDCDDQLVDPVNSYMEPHEMYHEHDSEGVALLLREERSDE